MNKLIKMLIVASSPLGCEEMARYGPSEKVGERDGLKGWDRGVYSLEEEIGGCSIQGRAPVLDRQGGLSGVFVQRVIPEPNQVKMEMKEDVNIHGA